MRCCLLGPLGVKTLIRDLHKVFLDKPSAYKQATMHLVSSSTSSNKQTKTNTFVSGQKLSFSKSSTNASRSALYHMALAALVGLAAQPGEWAASA